MNERRDRGRRVGFDCVSLDLKSRAPLADANGPNTGYMVGSSSRVDERSKS